MYNMSGWIYGRKWKQKGVDSWATESTQPRNLMIGSAEIMSSEDAIRKLGECTQTWLKAKIDDAGLEIKIY